MGRINLLEEIYNAQQGAGLPESTKTATSQPSNDHEIEEVINRVKSHLADYHSNLLSKSILDREVKEQVEILIANFISRNLIHVPGYTLDQLLAHISKEICGFGPLDPLLADDEITEIMVNNFREVYIEKDGKIQLSNVIFNSDEQLTNIVRKILAPIGRNIDLAEPYVDARLPGGSRVNAIISPISLSGTSLTIRKFARIDFDADKLIGIGTCTQEMIDFLQMIVKGKANILIIGGTGSGKTSTMKFITNFIPANERLITIEDIEELRLKTGNPQRHVISLEARRSKENPVSIYDLLVNALRMRPDRIIVGEVRGKEALEMLEAMNTGHEGSLSTLHANGPGEAIKRLALMIMRSGLDVEPQLVMELICDTVDFIVHQKRLPEDGSRKIVQITEITGYHDGQPQLQDIFRFEQTGLKENLVLGRHHQVGEITAKIREKLISHGIRQEEIDKYSLGRNNICSS